MMDYEALLAQVLVLLQQEQRLSYRVLKLRLQLDDETLEALKEDLIYAKQLAVDDAGRVLVWTGGVVTGPEPALPASPAEHPAGPATAARAHGAPRPGTPLSPEAERRQLTVLFWDGKGR
jgi:hypothetical protein